MERSGLNDMFRGRPSNAIAPQGYDLWNLYTKVRRHRPKIVMELGVGCSTYVLAEAPERNGEGRLYTVDANKHWLGVTQSEIPDRLKKRVEFVYSPCRAMVYEGEDCHHYTDLPDIVPDFFYLDGPDPTDVEGWPDERAERAVDPVLMEQSLRPGFMMVVDARMENLAFLKRHRKRRYRIRHHDIFKVTSFILR